MARTSGSEQAFACFFWVRWFPSRTAEVIRSLVMGLSHSPN